MLRPNGWGDIAVLHSLFKRFEVGRSVEIESRAGQVTGDGRKYGIDLPVFVTPNGAAFNSQILRLSSSSLRTVPTTLDNLRHIVDHEDEHCRQIESLLG